MPVADRLLILTPGFARARNRLGIVGGSIRGKALSGCVVAIVASSELPAPADVEAEFRPGTAYVRRVVGFNLWVWFRCSADRVTVLSVTDAPPVPWEE
jgi:hypothetical protein